MLLEKVSIEFNGHNYNLYLALSQLSNSHRNANETQEEATAAPGRRTSKRGKNPTS
jgi:hypothetical protein